MPATVRKINSMPAKNSTNGKNEKVKSLLPIETLGKAMAVLKELKIQENHTLIYMHSF